jgi:RimJ/RimL family protein N-acetyltransferase
MTNGLGNGSSSTVFETARLAVREAVPGDAAFIRSLWNDPAVMTFVGFPRGLQASQAEIERQIERARGTLDALLIAEEKASAAAVVQCKLGSPDRSGIAEPDIKLHPDVWGKGYGTELWTGLIDRLFETTDCVIVQGTPNVENEASIRMQKRCGMRCVGEGVFTFPDEMRSHTRPVRHLIYRLERTAWRRRTAKRSAFG